MRSAEGEYLAQYSAYSGALGVKSVAWAPSGQLVAVGSYDQVLAILHPDLVTSLDHT